MTTSATTAWISTLTDDGVRNDLVSLAADGALSYAEALQLLTDTARDGAFTVAEFQDLQTVAAHMNNGVTASSYVADIFIQLVQGNPANVSWHGGATYATPLGNLSAGSSAAQLDELIGKWFLGTDLPDPTLVPDDQRVVTQPHYAMVSGLLYGSSGSASIADVSQGSLGDCVVCANMIDMVDNHPDLLKSMIVDNGNGTYGVRFYLNGNEVWVTVDREFPVDAYGNLVYADNGIGQDKALWVPLLEKAYAQLSETGMVAHPPVNSYENIDGNSTRIVLPAMSNLKSTYYHTSASDWASNKQTLVDALAAHRDVVFETAHGAPHTYNSDGLTELVDAHAFAVLGYDEATGKFIVRNPWGDAHYHQSWTAQFELSMEQMAAEGGAVAVGMAVSAPEQPIQPAGASHRLGLATTVAVAPLFSVFNPDALTVSRYLFHAAGSGMLDLHGAVDLATAEQSAVGDVVVAAADLAKLQFVAPAVAGSGVLSIQALLGQQWSQAGDIHWSFGAASPDTIVLPKLHNAVAAGGSIAVASLFQLDGATGSHVYYEVVLPSGGGTLELHGARNLWTDAKPGQYEFNAADLQLVSYRAPISIGTVELDVNAYHGNGWDITQTVSVDVGVSDVAHALQSYANGQFTAITSVTDQSAAIFANFDSLQMLLRTRLLEAIHVDDVTPQVQAITGAQYDQYRGMYAVMTGNYALRLSDAAPADAGQLSTTLASHLTSASFIGSAADIAASLDALQALAAAGKLGAITLIDAGIPTLTMSGAQLTADSGALRAIVGNYRVTVQDTVAAALAAGAAASGAATLSYHITDNAENVSGGFDALQVLAAAGKLEAITLTEQHQPAIGLTVGQLSADADALAKLTGDYWLIARGAHAANLASLVAAYPKFSFAISDSAAQVLAHLDVLAPLGNRVVNTTLTDDGTPVLRLSAAQLAQSASLLSSITSPHQFDVPGVSAGEVNFIIAEDWYRPPQNCYYAMTDGGVVPDGANVVVGFRNAQMGDGHNAVVLDDARSHYALRVDSSGTVEIKNVAQGDADYNHSVTISGADYVIFGAATEQLTDNGIYFIADSSNTAVAELYVAAFGRLPDLGGLEYWESVLGGGASRADIAASFIASWEFQFRYPAAASAPDHGGAADQAFVAALYQNVLHRAPDAGGLTYWLGVLANGTSRADVLVSFAVSPEDETNTHLAPGHPDGWLIDTSKGGYADSTTPLAASTVLSQSLVNGYLNTGLIDPATIGTGVAAGGISLAGNTLTLAQDVTAHSIVLSSSVSHLVDHGDRDQIYSGGHATITIAGNGNTVHLNGADRLDLLDGSDTLVINFAPGSGATLHLAQGQPTLLEAAGQVNGATLDASHGYVIQVGSLGDGSASAAAAAINAACVVAGTAAEHITFIGQDSSGNMEAWRFGAGANVADSNGNHQVDAGELVHLATLVGVNAAQLHATDLA